MKRSLYKPGVEVFADHLNYTEETKIEAIKRIILDYGVVGPVKGCNVAPDPQNSYKVMVTQGYGYTYGGERYEITEDVHNVSIVNTIGAITYVAVKIVEQEIMKLPNVVTGEMTGTEIDVVTEIVSMSQQDWYNISDKSFYGLLAIVQGSGGVVRSSDIRRASIQPISVVFVDKQPMLISGVAVILISTNTQRGESSLKFRRDSKGFCYLSWRAPGNINYGQEVVIGVSGEYILWDSSQVSVIKVAVDIDKLPVDNSLEENILIIDLLEQFELSIGTMMDSIHRAMIGKGIPSPRNPHAQTLDDLDPGEKQDVLAHQYRMHGPGIVGLPGSVSLRPSIFGTSVLKVDNLSSGELVLSGAGNVFRQIAMTTVDFTGKASGVYYAYVDDVGNVSVSTSVDARKYFVIAKVTWNGALLSDLIDLRVWGTTRPDMNIQPDDDTLLLNVSQVSRTIADNLAKIRWVLNGIVGTNAWYQLPPATLKQLYDWYKIIDTDLIAHVNASLAGTDKVHGVKSGHGGGLDADTLDGSHAGELPSLSGGVRIPMAVEGVGVLSGAWLPLGHDPLGVQGVDADKVDGKHYYEIIDQMYQIASRIIRVTDIGGDYKDKSGDVVGSNLLIERLDSAGNVIAAFIVPSGAAGGVCFSSCFSSCHSICDCECGSLCRW